MSRDFLQHMILFRKLNATELAEILTLCVTKKVQAGKKIFAEGEKATKLFLIRDGEVRISKMVVGVGEEALAILKSGQFFGEMALIDERVRSAHAIAHTDCVLMEISIKDFMALLKKNQDTANKFLWEFCQMLCSRLRATNDKLYGIFAMSSFFK